MGREGRRALRRRGEERREEEREMGEVERSSADDKFGTEIP